MLEGKLAVLWFQIKIKEELESMASRSDVLPGTSDSAENGVVPEGSSTADANFANATREKAKELASDVKSITQLYNEYAVPFGLWEVLSFFFCLFFVFWLDLCSFRFFSSACSLYVSFELVEYLRV